MANCWSYFPGTAICPAGTSSCFGSTVDVVSVTVAVLTNGSSVTVQAPGGQPYMLVVSSGGNSSAAVSASMESAPCESASSVVGACLPLTLQVNTTEAVAAITVLLPPSINSAVPSGSFVELQDLWNSTGSGTGRRVSAQGCASSQYTQATGEVLAVNCSGGKYVLVITSNNLAPSPSPLALATSPTLTSKDIVLIAMGVLFGTVIVVGAVMLARLAFTRSRRASAKKVGISPPEVPIGSPTEFADTVAMARSAASPAQVVPTSGTAWSNPGDAAATTIYSHRVTGRPNFANPLKLESATTAEPGADITAL